MLGLYISRIKISIKQESCTDLVQTWCVHRKAKPCKLCPHTIPALVRADVRPVLTIERVADPLPAFASTTTVPAFWILSIMAAFSSSVKLTAGEHCEM